MATLLSTIITNARVVIQEETASHWTDAELLVHANDGIQDLWSMYIDVHDDFFAVEDGSNVSLTADATTVTGIPATCFRIKLIEPRDLSSASSTRFARFIPLDVKHRDFVSARMLDSQDPQGRIFYYDIIGQGPRTGAPTVRIAPSPNAAMNLRLFYIESLADKLSSANNPIPGGNADAALKHWIIAYALAKDREDHSPDPNHLQIYATLKANLKIAATPRQVQEEEVVEGLFEEYWQ